MATVDRPSSDAIGGAASGAQPRSRLPAFLAELRRRRVFRALLAWSVVSFAVLQVAEPVMHGLELPDWTLKAAIWALAAGFPVTSALAWIFDLGPGGITRTADAELGGPAAGPSRRRLALALGGLVAASALLGAGLAIVGVRRVMRPAAVGADGRVTVAVADFANETQDPDLDGLGDLLVTSLEQSRRLRVLTRSRMVDVLRQLGKPATQRIDEPLAREVGRREGVRALLHASVRRLGDTYAVNLRALDPVQDEYLFTLRETAQGKGAILDLVDRLSERARLRLQEPDAAVHASGVRVADAATGTLEAWRHYVEGLRHEDIGRFEAAVAEWRQAVALDGRFALAWFRISFRGENAGVAASERQQALEAALREIDRVPAKERLLIRAWKARVDGRPAEALAILSRAAEEYPRDKELAFMAGRVAWSAGGPGDAVAWFERAAALDPGWGQARNGLVTALATSGRKEEAIGRAREWVERGPDVTALRQLVWALQLAGRAAEAAPVARRILDLDGSPVARAWVASALTLADLPEEAEALARPHASPGAAAEVREALADALSAQGRRREALEVIAWEKEPASRAWGRYLVLMGDRHPGASLREAREVLRLGVGAGGIVTGAAYLGDAALVDTSAAMLPPGPGPQRAEYEAVKAWMRGEREQALARLRSLEGATGLGPKRHWWRARVAFELGRVDEGTAALEAFETEPTGLWRGWGRAQLLLYAAEAHARRGDREKALAALDRLERRLPKADPDFPQLEDARALRRRLEARASAGASP